MKTLFALLSVAWLSACTMIGHRPPPADWPPLSQTVTYTTMTKVAAACGIAPWILPFIQIAGCAVPNIPACTCDIYITESDDYVMDAALDHERDHCRGKDHFGSTYLSDLLAANREAAQLCTLKGATK